MLLEQVSDFVTWLEEVVLSRTQLNFNYFLFRTSISYRFTLLAHLELWLSDFEFKMLVINADYFCECQGSYVCSYCLVDQITQSMVSAAYQDLPLLDLDEIIALQ